MRRNSRDRLTVRSARTSRSDPISYPRERTEADRDSGDQSVKVLILGCGPAGLIAAHAAYNRGVDFVVVSKARKSFMNGAQYLHAPIPGVSIKDPFEINYELSGDVAGYRDKVYGPDSKVEVSPQSLLGRHMAWDIREAYDSLWGLYGSDVQDVTISPRVLSKLMD